MKGWYEDGEFIPDMSDWTDDDLAREEEHDPPWAGQPDLIDRGDILRKAKQESHS